MRTWAKMKSPTRGAWLIGGRAGLPTLVVSFKGLLTTITIYASLTTKIGYEVGRRICVPSPLPTQDVQVLTPEFVNISCYMAKGN